MFLLGSVHCNMQHLQHYRQYHISFLILITSSRCRTCSPCSDPASITVNVLLICVGGEPYVHFHFRNLLAISCLYTMQRSGLKSSVEERLTGSLMILIRKLVYMQAVMYIRTLVRTVTFSINFKITDRNTNLLALTVISKIFERQ